MDGKIIEPAPAMAHPSAAEIAWPRWYPGQRRIRRFMKHYPWTQWTATVSPDPATGVGSAGVPLGNKWIIELHTAHGPSWYLFSNPYQALDQGWSGGLQTIYFAGELDGKQRGVISRTLGDIPSMAYHYGGVPDRMKYEAGDAERWRLSDAARAAATDRRRANRGA